MKVEFQLGCQDIAYRITQRELNQIKGSVTDYYVNALIGRAKDAECYFYLGHSNGTPFFSSSPLEGLLQINPSKSPELPFQVNLLDSAIERLDKEKNLSVRIPGGSKLLIIVDE